ncbi:MAG TPA: hypothetical protein VIE17_03805 [Methylophilaceae bacterium]|jgi:hypothetical protein
MRIKHIISAIFVASLIAALPMHANADADGTAKKKTSKAAAKTFDEGQFIRMFSNKTRQQVSEALGKPASTNQGRPPSAEEAAAATLGQGQVDGARKSDSVEMWYYKHLVRYAPKRTYDKVELTFVNDRCMNVAYFNDRK